MLAWKSAWNTKSVRCSIWKRETGASFQHATTHRQSTIGEKHRLGYIFINQLNNSSTLRPLRCGACCKNPSAYPSAWTHTSSVVGSCFIYKLGMLTGQRFQAELSPSFLWKFTEFRAETPPHAFGIPNCVTPPRLRNSSPRNPPSPSEFQDAARGMVWIFSGITQSLFFFLTGTHWLWTGTYDFSQDESQDQP